MPTLKERINKLENKMGAGESEQPIYITLISGPKFPVGMKGNKCLNYQKQYAEHFKRMKHGKESNVWIFSLSCEGCKEKCTHVKPALQGPLFN